MSLSCVTGPEVSVWCVTGPEVSVSCVTGPEVSGVLQDLKCLSHVLQDLNCLIERYLEPLKEETFLSGEDIEQLFGNIQEIVTFQRMFLQSLEEAIEMEPNFSTITEPKHFRVGVKAVGLLDLTVRANLGIEPGPT